MPDNDSNHNFPAHTEAGGVIGGTLIGAYIIVVLNNVPGLRNIDPDLRQALKGAIIIAAVLLQNRQD
ncbi:MAG: hypothetical protein R6V10_05295 [bacterium]